MADRSAGGGSLGAAQNNWLLVLRALLRRADLASLLVFGAWALLSLANRAFMAVEEALLYLHPLKHSPHIVWILGHQRSGTTNLEEALYEHKDAVYGQVYDAIFPSITLKLLFYPLRVLLEPLLKYFCDTANHPASLELGLEEDLCLMHHGASHLFLIVHGLTRAVAPSRPGYYTRMTTYTDHHVAYIRRVVQRILWMRQLTGRLSKDSVYFGKPLTFTKAVNLDKLLAAFPGSNIVLCIRDPMASFPSFVDLLASQTRTTPCDAAFREFVRKEAYEYSSDCYKGMLHIVTRDNSSMLRQGRVVPVLFSDWVSGVEHKLAILRYVSEFVGLDLVTQYEAIDHKARADAFGKKEKHINRGDAFTAVTPEQIQAELGPVFQQVVEAARPFVR